MVELTVFNRAGEAVGVTIVDDEDADLSVYRWGRDRMGYIRRYGRWPDGRNRQIRLHRVILERALGRDLGDLDVDHINLNPGDNRRQNLREATRRQNSQNRRGWQRSGVPISSPFKGVTWDKDKRRWRALIVIDGQQHRLGRFVAEEAAARAYDRAAIEHFGPFARVNFPI